MCSDALGSKKIKETSDPWVDWCRGGVGEAILALPAGGAGTRSDSALWSQLVSWEEAVEVNCCIRRPQLAKGKAVVPSPRARAGPEKLLGASRAPVEEAAGPASNSDTMRQLAVTAQVVIYANISLVWLDQHRSKCQALVHSFSNSSVRELLSPFCKEKEIEARRL